MATWMVLGQQGRRVDDLALRNAGKTGEEWLTYGSTPAETRYEPPKTTRCYERQPSGTGMVL